MEMVATRLLDFLRPGDTVVDFSCGSNEFVPMVKKMALGAGIEVFGRAYDIITARHFEDLVIKSWFDVTRGEAQLVQCRTAASWFSLLRRSSGIEF